MSDRGPDHWSCYGSHADYNRHVASDSGVGTGGWKNFKRGYLDARADVDSRDEIAVLADRFNDMAGNIQTLVVKVREDEQKIEEGRFETSAGAD